MKSGGQCHSAPCCPSCHVLSTISLLLSAPEKHTLLDSFVVARGNVQTDPDLWAPVAPVVGNPRDGVKGLPQWPDRIAIILERGVRERANYGAHLVDIYVGSCCCERTCGARWVRLISQRDGAVMRR
jgi:hypothetical protein